VAALCNDTAQAQAVMDEIAKLYPKDTVDAVIVSNLMKAYLELNRGNGAAAQQILESIRTYDLGLFVGVERLYLSGEAHLQQKMAKEAVQDFEQVINNRGVDPFTVLRPLAYVGLARAYVLMNDTAKARKAYQDFLALWKDADPDLKVVAEAKKEYADLTTSAP